ncbi:DUF4288 domain-containing protein, partial [Streptomyces sp. NPDC001941]|uniref:DUF4288 domain-containing protein n=1 Tax=Streptomyces sp. NPDC001941 TaxID=3154659 RepID=UPI003334926E
MPRYVAVLVLGTGTSPGLPPLYQENLVLLEARDEEEARQRARSRGLDMETSYANERGEQVTWRLLHVVDVAEVTDDLGDGAELYTRHFRDYDAYRTFEPLLSDIPCRSGVKLRLGGLRGVTRRWPRRRGYGS